MSHDKYNIDRIIELARIKLSGQEHDRYMVELNDILDYVSKLRPIPTETVPPTDHAIGNESVSRSDSVQLSSPNPIIALAPGGNYQIPSVRSLWTS